MISEESFLVLRIVVIGIFRKFVMSGYKGDKSLIFLVLGWEFWFVLFFRWGNNLNKIKFF